MYFRLMAAIFDFSLIRTSGSLRSSLVVLPDVENMGIAVFQRGLVTLESHANGAFRELVLRWYFGELLLWKFAR